MNPTLEFQPMKQTETSCCCYCVIVQGWAGGGKASGEESKDEDLGLDPALDLERQMDRKQWGAGETRCAEESLAKSCTTFRVLGFKGLRLFLRVSRISRILGWF